jgi:methylglyoxal synthase
LIAHDGRKTDMLEWAKWNRELLARHEIWATHHTGELVTEELGLPVHLLLPGPEGGDAQVAAMIARRELDLVVFLWDPLATQPHEDDVRSVLRLAVLHDVAIACNRRSADLIISSPLLRRVDRSAA